MSRFPLRVDYCGNTKNGKNRAKSSLPKFLSEYIANCYVRYMPDKFTKSKRSEIMSKIRSRDTKIELKMKEALKNAGIEFEYQPKMFGKPDFLIQPKIVIFCDSSFWHGRNWNMLKRQLPSKYWYEHIKKNRERDKIVNKTLKQEGYIVLRFWDDQIEKETEECINKIREKILNANKLSDFQDKRDKVGKVIKCL